MKVLRHPKSDGGLIMPSADKGMALVVMDRQDYIRKSKVLLEISNTYRPIPTDPTNKHKARLISVLKKVKVEIGMGEMTYKKMYPTGASSPKSYGLPKIHKKDIPLRSIVSSRGSVRYGVAKELARILKPLVGRAIHHVRNTKEFADQINNTKLEVEDCIISYYVTALFAAVPFASAIDIIKNKFEQD